jgi:hypothetical protein
MDFTSESRKPIFVTRSSAIQSYNSSRILNESLANFSAIPARNSQDIMVKASAARLLPRATLVTLTNATSAEVKELVIARLENDREEKFEFLDGRTFSGPEAATQIKDGTRIGDYFLALEKETLKIVQEAFFRGEF